MIANSGKGLAAVPGPAQGAPAPMTIDIRTPGGVGGQAWTPDLAVVRDVEPLAVRLQARTEILYRDRGHGHIVERALVFHAGSGERQALRSSLGGGFFEPFVFCPEGFDALVPVGRFFVAHGLFQLLQLPFQVPAALFYICGLFVEGGAGGQLVKKRIGAGVGVGFTTGA